MKEKLWKEIRKYNDEFFWPDAKLMTVKELGEYLKQLKKQTIREEKEKLRQLAAKYPDVILDLIHPRR